MTDHPYDARKRAEAAGELARIEKLGAAVLAAFGGVRKSTAGEHEDLLAWTERALDAIAKDLSAADVLISRHEAYRQARSTPAGQLLVKIAATAIPGGAHCGVPADRTMRWLAKEFPQHVEQLHKELADGETASERWLRERAQILVRTGAEPSIEKARAVLLKRHPELAEHVRLERMGRR